MKITIQIVNFRSRKYLSDCIFSVRENLPSGVKAEILVINNDSVPLEKVSYDINDVAVSFLENGKNIGFGRAHNFGSKKALGEYILFLNPDTRILPGALREMLEIFAADEKLGIVGPMLLDSANKIQSECFGARKTPLSTIGEKIFSRRKDDSSPEIHEKLFEVDWVSGGALMARRDVFEKAGKFDENYFMYFEDVDLCLQVKKLGYKVAVNPAAKIFHEGGKSFESEREKKRLYYASQDYYLQKNFGMAAAGLVKLVRLPYYVRNVYLGR